MYFNKNNLDIFVKHEKFEIYFVCWKNDRHLFPVNLKQQKTYIHEFLHFKPQSHTNKNHG